jgi:predicted nucleotide-binding protein
VSEDSGPARTLKAGLAVKVLKYGNDHFVKARETIISALQETLSVTNEDRFNELKKASSKNISSQISNKIFIVHGHDHNFKHELEIFLTEIGLQPIVLHREADEGKTIIEKFEKHSDVGYAFILLSPDEIAYASEQDKLEDINRTKEHRARPNVIFEFGYFVGKLSRERVCCLMKGNVTRPSDLDGLVYKRIDNKIESEGYSIIKELKAAGYMLKI